MSGLWLLDVNVLVALSYIAGHRQLTDVYLLGLAKKMKGRLATFDQTIPLKSVIGASKNTVAVISPVD